MSWLDKVGGFVKDVAIGQIKNNLDPMGNYIDRLTNDEDEDEKSSGDKVSDYLSGLNISGIL